jgi:hypothetical protein
MVFPFGSRRLLTTGFDLVLTNSGTGYRVGLVAGDLAFNRSPQMLPNVAGKSRYRRQTSPAAEECRAVEEVEAVTWRRERSRETPSAQGP